MAVTELLDNLVHRVNVGDTLTRTADRLPATTALVDGDRRISYRELDDWTDRLARALVDRGYAPGDSLALASGNSTEFLAVYYACAKAGVVCVPLNLGWRPDEAGYVLGHAGVRGVVVETQLAGWVEQALAGLDGVRDVVLAPGTGGDVPTTLAGRSTATLEAWAADAEPGPVEVVVPDRAPITYLYTSGTTSAPKGVVGTHLAVVVESLTMALEARWTDEDRFLAMMPMFHTAQLNCFCTPAVVLGATLVVHRGFDPDRFLDTVEAEGITQVFGLPMMYRALTERPDIGQRDLSSLRRACYAMAPMPEPQLRRALDVFGCEFFLLFGQTEMSPTTTLFRPEHQLTHAGAVGTPTVSVRVALMGPDGERVGPGEQGEIVYRSPQALAGYLHDDAATEAAFAGGWFHSGDIGRFDDDGVLWFADRSKDVIKTGGENVASIEVERALYAADPRIAEVVAVGLPHERWSEAITAVVVPVAGARIDEAELLTAVRAHLDPYKVPKAVVVLDDLPRTSTGKVQKNVLRRRLADHYSGGTA
ncbi:AMP-binding protein [Klenkia sp. PcliD-1-E]|uniref:AMP-binding protein n=1 Tax=Klenkia sp. PcliD-1-E TaxID=2954492 RepID=UPI0020984372|nr:AMP-binding protein [Klenkia sp. PcliD-1-E]MCO7221427.1 AMP-binding protein [Klenkia sp. PcliD-1-E]